MVLALVLRPQGGAAAPCRGRGGLGAAAAVAKAEPRGLLFRRASGSGSGKERGGSGPAWQCRGPGRARRWGGILARIPPRGGEPREGARPCSSQRWVGAAPGGGAVLMGGGRERLRAWRPPPAVLQRGCSFRGVDAGCRACRCGCIPSSRGLCGPKSGGCFLSFSSSARGALWEEWRRGTPCWSLHAEGPLGASRPAALLGGWALWLTVRQGRPAALRELAVIDGQF